jgi:hypothetical protein
MNWIANYLSLYDSAGKTFQTFHPKFGFPKGMSGDEFAALIRKKETEWAATLKANPYSQTKILLDDEEKKILTFYAPFIDRLFRDRRPTVIPFFSDMTTFSAHPAIKAYLEKMAVETWYDVNVSLSSILEVLVFGGHAGKTMHAFEINRLDRQIKAYLDEKMQPIVFIHLPSFGKDTKRIHVLRVLGSEWKADGDQFVVKVVDPNFEPGGNIWEIQFAGVKSKPEDVQAVYVPYRSLQVDPQGKVRSLTDVEVAPFFDRLSVETLQSWKRFLSKDGEDALSRLEATAQEKPKVVPAPPVPAPPK